MANERQKLKRTIGLAHLVGIEVGQTIGAGIFALTGIALAYTGASLPLAFLVAAIPVGVVMSVLAMLGAAMPISGGTYVYGSRLFSPIAAFTGVWAYILGALLGMFPLYALTGADFLRSVFPALPRMPVAIILLTVFYTTNLFGVKIAMWVQAIFVAILLIALSVFIVNGFGVVTNGNWQPFFGGGVSGFAVAASILTFTVMGANAAVELGDEIKRPSRNIPLSFAIAIPLVVVFYLLISTIAAASFGSTGTGDTALSLIASEFMSGPAFIFFVVGGGFLAVMTTLNATYLWGTKSLIVMAEDGLIPQKAAAVSLRFGTPHVLLTGIYVISVASLLIIGERTETFAVFASLGGIIILLPVMGAALNFKKKRNDLYETSQFKLKGWYYTVAPVLGIALSIVIVIILIADLSSHYRGWLYVIVFIAWSVFGALYATVRTRRSSSG